MEGSNSDGTFSFLRRVEIFAISIRDGMEANDEGFKTKIMFL